MAAPAPALTREAAWLYGRTLDLLIGAGGLYLLSVPALLLVAGTASVHRWPTLVVAGISLLLSAPHYGATLLRVYERAADRRRYAFFTYHVTGLLGLAFVVGVYQPLVGSILVTLYATLSPWHFAGQNYGVALMFLRRRGVPISPLAKRVFYASFILSFLLAFLSIHFEASRIVFAAGTGGGARYAIQRADIPLAAVRVLAPLLGAAYLGSIAWAARLLLRGAQARDLVPAALLVLTQSLWFAVPALLHITRPDAAELLPFASIWISGAHSVQYLWVTTFYAQRAEGATRTAPYLGRALLAGAFVTVLPGLLLAPAVPVSWYGGLAVVLFAVVNLHHFALDGAIWKLRDGAVARALLRTDGAPPTPAATAPERAGILRRLVFAGGATALALSLYEVGERHVVLRTDWGDGLERAEGVLDRLRRVGRDAPADRVALARAFAARGQPGPAEAQYRRSLELYPSRDAWVGLGDLLRARPDREGALAAYRAALELAPGDVTALYYSALISLRLEREATDAAGAPLPAAARHRGEAIAALERTLSAAPRHAKATRRLALAYARDGRPEAALAFLELARPRLRPEARPSLDPVLDELRAALDAGRGS